jgi:lipoprotein-anchoring transpeptidase ErfK/SrfK
MRRLPATFLGALVILAACGQADDAEPRRATTDADAAAERRGTASAIASGRADLSPEEIEAGRLDGSWRTYARPRDGAPGPDPGRGPDGEPHEEVWEDISPATVNGPPGLPLYGDVAGPSVAKIQIMLDRARFSPGIIDGRWGKNTEKAVYYFQQSNALSATGRVDSPTVDALRRVAGDEQVRTHRLTDADVAGPFVDVPEDIYERAELECLCYESLREKLGEVFHSSPELLALLNPGVDLNGLAAGDELSVPAVEPFRVAELPEGEYTEGREVRRLVVSGRGHYVHALNAAGDILYHFPSTLGAEYSPEPGNDYTVRSITFHPDWHYQPTLLRDVDPDDEEAVIPAGPNNDVGVVWMALSEPHYGIHGTRAPETIGYAVSSGCVRLTNWDAAFLARRVPPGTRVEFTDVGGPPS